MTIRTSGWLHSGHRTQSGSPYPNMLIADMPTELVGGRTPDWRIGLHLELCHHCFDRPWSEGCLLRNVDERDDRPSSSPFGPDILEHAIPGQIVYRRLDR